jgi:hypothetical protein
LLLAALRCDRVTLFGLTCERGHAGDAGLDAADAGEEAAAAVAAEERAWRVFLARRGTQFAFARDAADVHPAARTAGG